MSKISSEERISKLLEKYKPKMIDTIFMERKEKLITKCTGKKKPRG